jgi:hypothetical protein
VVEMLSLIAKEKKAKLTHLVILDAHIHPFLPLPPLLHPGRKEDLARLLDHFFIERRFIRLV